MSDTVDLDVIRPKPKFIKLGEKKIDVSFIPCGITFDIDQLMQKLSGLDIEEIQKGGAEAKKAFEMSVELCVIFCQHKYSEMDNEWFLNNVDAMQVQQFAEVIKDTLAKSYDAVSKYGEASPKN